MGDPVRTSVIVECPSCGANRRIPVSEWETKGSPPCDNCACDRMQRVSRHNNKKKHRAEKPVVRCRECFSVLLASERPGGVCRRCATSNLVSA